MSHTDISVRIANIPAIARVTEYAVYPSSQDDPGGMDLEYTICDSRGRPADWLERKLTDRQRQELDETVAEAMRVELKAAREDHAYDEWRDRQLDAA